MGSIGGHVSEETLVAGNLPKEVKSHKIAKGYINKINTYSLKSLWSYGWVDISKYCCIIEPEPINIRNEDDYGKDGNWYG